MVNGKCVCKEKIKLKSKVQPNDDNHPFIIKNPRYVEFHQLGVGYELFNAMHRYADQICEYIEATDEPQTYGEILRNATSIALKLKEKGFNEESIICLCLPNGKHTISVYLAGLFLGCKMNFLDMTFQINDIAYLLNVVKPNLMIININKLEDIKAALKQNSFDIDIITVGGESDGHECLSEYLEAPQEDTQKFKPYKVDSLKRTCIIMFTSGTVGLPNVVCLSHLTMLYQFYYSALTGNYVRTFLTYASLYWISSTVLTGACLLGGITRIISTNIDCNHIYKMIDKYKITCTFFGPYHCSMFLNTPKPPDVDTSSFKCLMLGGSIIQEVIVEGLKKLFPSCFICQVYGQTEVGGTLLRFSLNSQQEIKLANSKPKSCGMAHGNYWYKIVDQETGEILAPNHSGELCVKSEAIMSGYLNQNSPDFLDENGWLKTGDIIYYDDYHLFYFVDRMKEVIKYRDWNISPGSLELVLMKIPVVERAVVVGIPNKEDGERAIGLIKLKKDVDPNTVNLEEIADFVNKQVDERNELKAGVRIINNIPLTASGKIRRTALRDSIVEGKEI